MSDDVVTFSFVVLHDVGKSESCCPHSDKADGNTGKGQTASNKVKQSDVLHEGKKGRFHKVFNQRREECNCVGVTMVDEVGYEAEVGARIERVIGERRHKATTKSQGKF